MSVSFRFEISSSTQKLSDYFSDEWIISFFNENKIVVKTLVGVFWSIEIFILLLLIVPVLRFLRDGWEIRRQEFANKFKEKDIDFYLNRYWDQTLIKNLKISSEPNDKKFAYVYNLAVGRKWYVTPFLMMIFIIFIFSGFVLSTALRYGYDQYIQDNIYWIDKDKFFAAKNIIHLKVSTLDILFFPFSQITLTLPVMLSICGAYLYIVTSIIQGYRSRTLLSSDLWLCCVRMIIAVPLGLALSFPATDANVGPFVGFALGAFPLDAIMRLLRRLLERSLRDSEQSGDDDKLTKIPGVTPAIAAQLAGEGIESIQQLSGIDPVSLAIRTGLSFENVLNLAAQSQTWNFIGRTASLLAPLGLSDARSIAKLTGGIGNANANDMAVLNAAAKAVNVDAEVLKFNFINITSDKYTKFLEQFGVGPNPFNSSRKH